MAVRFDAITDVLKRTGGVGLTSNAPPHTMCGWVKRVVDRDGFFSVINLNNGTSSFGDNITSDSGGDIAQYMDIDGDDLISGPTLTLDGWFFVAGVIDISGGTRTFYWRADAAGSLSSGADAAISTAQLANLTQLWIGVDPWNDLFDGSICCVRLWNAALDSTELLAESNSPTAVRTSGLQGAWRLETSSDLADTSGNSRTLTAGSTAVDTDADEPDSIAVVTGQTVTPTAIVETNSWTGVVGNLADADDGTIVESPSSPTTAQPIVLRASAAGDPGVHTGHQVTFRARRAITSGSPAVNVTPVWRTGYVNSGSRGTVIKTGTPVTLTDSFDDYLLTLSEAEAGNIPGAEYASGVFLELIPEQA